MVRLVRCSGPIHCHEKEYRVLVARRPDEEQLDTWRREAALEDGCKTAPAEVRIDSRFGKGTWLWVALKEGPLDLLNPLALDRVPPIVL